jgi:hypothetical protein
MSRSGKIELDWADGRHVFRLAIGQLEELQEKAGAGPLEVMRRLISGTWRVADVREPIRLGLIGAGMTPAEAVKLVNRYAGDGALLQAVEPAMAILGAALQAPKDEPVGKAAAAEPEATADPMAA